MRYRAFIIFGVAILIVIFGIVLIFGGNSKKPTTPATAVKNLPDYSTTSAETSMTIRGIINGEDIHRSIRITVSQDQRRLDIISGYSDQVIQSQTFVNSQPAYNQFLYAIKDAGFMIKKKEVTPTQAQPNGKCPLGNLYSFELNSNGEDLSNLWASSCEVHLGILGGDSSLLQTLFENQITNYDQLVSRVQL